MKTKKLIKVIILILVSLAIISCRQDATTKIDVENIKNVQDGKIESVNFIVKFEIVSKDDFIKYEDYLHKKFQGLFPYSVSNFEFGSFDFVTDYVKFKTKIPFVNYHHLNKESKNLIDSSIMYLCLVDSKISLCLNNKMFQPFETEIENGFSIDVKIEKMFFTIDVTNENNNDILLKLYPNYINGQAKIHMIESKVEQSESIVLSNVSLSYLKSSWGVPFLKIVETTKK